MVDKITPNPETSETVVVVQRQLDAYNARDIETFAATYAPTIKILRLPDGDVVLDGLESLRNSYGKLFADSPNLHCEILSRIVLDNYVIDHEYVTGRGAAHPLTAVVIYEVSDKLIQQVWILRG